MVRTRTYNYRNTRIATIWIGVAIACVVAIVTLYNQAQIRAQAIDSLSRASNAVIVQPAQTQQTQPSQSAQPSCYNGGAPVFDPAKCAVPTATSN